MPAPCEIKKSTSNVVNVDVRKLVFIEFAVLLGWFMFYLGAWSLLDMIGLTGLLVVNVVFMIVGVAIVMFIVVYTRKSSYT